MKPLITGIHNYLYTRTNMNPVSLYQGNCMICRFRFGIKYHKFAASLPFDQKLNA